MPVTYGKIVIWVGSRFQVFLDTAKLSEQIPKYVNQINILN